jgi:DNA repair protein RecO (recombination protein O)
VGDSNPARTVVDRAFLLRAVDFGDADRIVTFLAEETGKVSALARGARKSKRRFAGSLEPFSLLEIELKHGRGELDTLVRSKLAGSYPSILASLEKMTACGQALAIVRHLAPAREGDARLFRTVIEWFEMVEGAPAETLREFYLAFAIRVLALGGFAPEVDRCARSGETASAERVVLFDPRVGSVVSSKEGGGPIRLSPAARDFVRRARAKAWTSAGRLAQGDLDSARKLVEGLFEHQVGAALGGLDAIDDARTAGARRGAQTRDRGPKSVG